MTSVTILLPAEAAVFYSRLADTVGLPLEQVLSDALFKLAGELSLEALCHIPTGRSEEGNT